MTSLSKPASSSSVIPLIDLSKPDSSKHLIVKACEEFGFFKVINHGVPMDLIDRLEREAVKFFSLPESEKDRPPNQFPIDSQIHNTSNHTDPQIISIIRSNNTSGLQILGDGTWIPVPPDQYSFFINVGDTPQVLKNGRFQSVRHRVLANESKSRVSMIFFGGSPLNEKNSSIAICHERRRTEHVQFTWFEYKAISYQSRLADSRLAHFERTEDS